MEQDPKCFGGMNPIVQWHGTSNVAVERVKDIEKQCKKELRITE